MHTTCLYVLLLDYCRGQEQEALTSQAQHNIFIMPCPSPTFPAPLIFYAPQGPGIAKASKVAGPFRALWNLVGILTLLMVVSAAWLVGSQALRSAAAGTLGISSGVMTSAAAAPSAAAPSAAGASSSAGGLQEGGGGGCKMCAVG